MLYHFNTVKVYVVENNEMSETLRGYERPRGGNVNYGTVLYCTVLNCYVLRCIALHRTVLYCTALHCTVVECTVCTVHCNKVYSAICLKYTLLKNSVQSSEPSTVVITHPNIGLMAHCYNNYP